MATKAELEDIYGLSPMQKGMLFHSIYSPESDVYFEQMCFEMAGELDRSAFERAWQALVDRHTVFRTAFVWENLAEPVQVVLRRVRLKVAWEDWRSRDVALQQRELELYLERDRKTGFRLTHAPLMRVSVIELPDGTRRVVWSHHHLLLDGWCLNLVFNEFFALYAAAATGQSPALPAPRPYRSYIDWLAAKPESAESGDFWRRYLAGCRGTARLAIDRSGATASYQLSGYFRVTQALPAELTGKLSAMARACQVTPSTVTQVAWALLLSRYSGSNDVIFGATVAGRSSDLPGVASMLGMFINTLPVRVRVEENSTLSALMQRVQAEQAVARQFETSALSEIRKCAELDPGAPLFESNLAFQNYPALDQQHTGAARSLNGTWRGPTNFALSATIEPGPELVAGIASYESRFDRCAVQRMLGHWLQIISAIVQAPERTVASVPLATPGEVRQLTETLNQTAWEPGAPSTLPELLDRSFRMHGDASALVQADGTDVRYAELAQRVEELVAVLRALGVGPEVRVGIHLERGSAAAVVGVCATLLAGGVFVPVDASLPPLRVMHVFDQARPAVILTQAALRGRFASAAASVLVLDEALPSELARQRTSEPCGVSPEHLAYVIYTSGSTGKPKGVAVEQRGIANNLLDLNQRFGIGPGDRVFAISSLSFDMSVYEIVGTLIAGATLVLPSAAELLDPSHWARLVRAHSVTVWNSAPALLNVLVEYAAGACPDALASLRVVILGGDWVPLDLPQRLRALAPTVRFVSLGGATEASIHSTVFEVNQLDPAWKSIPYGTPLANQTAYVLDAELRPLPIGLPGELYLGGMGLGRGYDGAARATAERFLANPYGTRPGERLYRTGDLARFGEDGVLELLGRIDHQIKIRGNRVEPDEVAAVLRRHPQVRQAIVRVLADAKAEPALVAYVIAGEVADAELSAHVREQLPSYMAPSAFVRMDSFPLSANGKIDRGSLPAPAWQGASRSAGRQLATDTESQLAELWGELTGGRVESAGAHFFELGGDSLRALRLASVVRARMGVALPVRAVFERPVLSDLGAYIDELRSSSRASIEGAA